MIRVLLRLVVVGLALLCAVAPLPRWAVERWYSTGLYPGLQAAITPLTNLVPVALLDLALLLLVAGALWRFGRVRRRLGLLRAAGSAAVGLVTWIAVLYLVFLVVWGFNYRRVAIEQKIEFDEGRVTPEAARQLARDAVAHLNGLHARAHVEKPGGPTLEQAFAQAERRLGSSGSTAPGVPKRSALELYFRWAAIDGMTDPFFLEIILNPDILAIERPFVLAHEWGHLAGYADEDEANLIAWLACLEGNAHAQYSGWLSIYSHVMSGLPRAERGTIAADLAAGPRRDLEARAARYELSKPAVRHMARETYDAYLRANRVEGGIESYDAVVRLILGAGREHGWAPRARNAD